MPNSSLRARLFPLGLVRLSVTGVALLAKLLSLLRMTFSGSPR